MNPVREESPGKPEDPEKCQRVQESPTVQNGRESRKAGGSREMPESPEKKVWVSMCSILTLANLLKQRDFKTIRMQWTW